MNGRNRACTLPAEVEEGGTGYAETEEETYDGSGRKCIVLQYWTVDDATERIGERMVPNPGDYGGLLEDLDLKGAATTMTKAKNGAPGELASECTDAIAADRDVILPALGISGGRGQADQAQGAAAIEPVPDGLRQLKGRASTRRPERVRWPAKIPLQATRKHVPDPAGTEKTLCSGTGDENMDSTKGDEKANILIIRMDNGDAVIIIETGRIMALETGDDPGEWTVGIYDTRMTTDEWMMYDEWRKERKTPLELRIWDYLGEGKMYTEVIADDSGNETVSAMKRNDARTGTIIGFIAKNYEEWGLPVPRFGVAETRAKHREDDLETTMRGFIEKYDRTV